MALASPLIRDLSGPQRRAAVVLVAFAAVAGLASLRRRLRGRALPPEPLLISLTAVFRLLREGRVKELAYGHGGGLLLSVRRAQGAEAAHFASHLVPGAEATLFELADRTGVMTLHAKPPPPSSQVVPWLVTLGAFFLWYRMAKSLLSKEEKFVPRGRSSAREAITFSDVICKSKVELEEIVDYLNQPGKYRRAGARLPRGALLVGPSGTGKTLLARAVAGEARCAFLSASGSEFVEVYVGRGAARIRELFRQARAMAPVVLFLDELDALGCRRGSSSVQGSNEEYVQTINQLLTELDGFHGQSDGVVVLGATNRREALDPALLRPGRFDRHVRVELPDEEERLEILELYAGRAASAKSLGAAALQRLAAQSAGLSGAELANIVNEAVFLALRDRRVQATEEDCRAALERVRAAHNGAHAAEPVGSVGLRSFLRAWPHGAAVA